MARGLLAEHALWQGDYDEALTQAEAAIAISVMPPQRYSPPVIALFACHRR